MLAAATLEVRDETGRKIVFGTKRNEVEEAVQNESRKRRRTANGSRCAKWRHMDINRDTAEDRNISPSAQDAKTSPCSLLEGFLHRNFTNLFVWKLLSLLTQMSSEISNSLLTN